MKICGTCKLEKLESEFATKDATTGKLQSYCKVCQKAYRKGHYEQNKQKYIDKARIWDRSFRTWFNETYKSDPCLDCQQKYPYYVMDFDHRDGAQKEHAIAKLISTGNRDRLAKEIEKCDLVCANCHRIRTHERLADVA